MLTNRRRGTRPRRRPAGALSVKKAVRQSMTIYPVIMCGGAGTRLWPASTSRHPKQFASLVTSSSVFEDTLDRVSPARLPGAHPAPLIISNAAYLALIEAQLDRAGIDPLAILLEPMARNTAAVAALASETIRGHDRDGLVLLLPSDHFVADPGAFCAAVAEAAPVAASGYITTFGITPTRPDTGFGYIEAGTPLAPGIARVATFKEKPDLATAESYLADPAFSWNAGIFLFPCQLMLDELARHAPGVLEPARRALAAARRDGPAVHLASDAFADVTAISVDYAVMEKTAFAAVRGPVACGWNDLGTWPIVGDLQRGRRDPEPVLIDTSGCVVHTDGTMLITAIGVDDLVIVAVDGAVLVMPKSRAQDVGRIVAELKARGDVHRT